MTRNALAAAYAPLERWLFEAALPIWATAGRDAAGGFFEKIAQDGAPIDGARRTRLVARQIFAFAAAREMGWDGPCDALIAHGLTFFRDRCLAPDGLCYSVVVHDGPPPQPEFDTYDHAFALFALAAATRAGHDPDMNARTAHAMLSAMRQGFAQPEAGFHEGRPPVAPLLANPHMHLLEAALEWMEAAPADTEWGGLADELANLALARFVDSETGAIREEYDLDWTAWTDAPEIVEPGHQFEWAWLLLRWGRLRRRADAQAAARRLADIAEMHGIDGDGLVVNALDRTLGVTDADRRLWPQTERIKAHLALGDTGRAAAALATLPRHFKTRTPGLWVETLKAGGGVVEEPARGSSLYHIVCALREVARALQVD